MNRMQSIGMRSRIRVFFVLLWVVSLGYLLVVRGYRQQRSLGGDEVHYLVASISLKEDGDFDLSNNYKERVYSRPPLNMSYQWPHCHPYYTDLKAQCLPVHSFWHSILLTPIFYTFGKKGIFALNALLMVCSAAFLGLALRRLLKSEIWALVYSFLFALSGPISNSSVPIFPTPVSTFLTALGLGFFVPALLAIEEGGARTGSTVGLIPNAKEARPQHWRGTLQSNAPLSDSGKWLLGTLFCFCLHPFAHHTNALIAGLGTLYALVSLRREIRWIHLFLCVGLGTVWFVTPYLLGGDFRMGASVSAPAFTTAGFQGKLVYHILNAGQGLLPNASILICLFIAPLALAASRRAQRYSQLEQSLILMGALLLFVAIVFFSLANTGPGDSPTSRYFVYLMPLFVLSSILTLNGLGRSGRFAAAFLLGLSAISGFVSYREGCFLATCFGSVASVIPKWLGPFAVIFELEKFWWFAYGLFGILVLGGVLVILTRGPFVNFGAKNRAEPLSDT